jgi:hypothetical protein
MGRYCVAFVNKYDLKEFIEEPKSKDKKVNEVSLLGRSVGKI